MKNNNIKTKIINIKEIRQYARALHCPTRWEIIGVLADKNLSTGEISEALREKGMEVEAQNLYYHLSELGAVGIIGVSSYREVGGGAPEKVWELKVRKLTINLIKE